MTGIQKDRVALIKEQEQRLEFNFLSEEQRTKIQSRINLLYKLNALDEIEITYNLSLKHMPSFISDFVGAIELGYRKEILNLLISIYA